MDPMVSLVRGEDKNSVILAGMNAQSRDYHVSIGSCRHDNKLLVTILLKS